MSVRIEPGDMREVLARLKGEGVRVQSIVTDPPYHLTSIVKRFGGEGVAPAKSNGPTGAYARASRGFMGKQWDGGDIAFRPETWRLCWELLPPGGWLLAFSGTRTYHRMACAIEDAGFEIRDMMADLVAAEDAVERFMASLTEAQAEAFLRCIAESTYGGMLAWIYGSGFPKSLNISKAIDKAAGAERESDVPVTAAAAAAWQGWGTALKPALEPICCARKPLEGTNVANVLKHGVGALNIDGCRIHADDAQGGAYTVRRLKPGALLEATGGNWRPDGGALYHGETKPGRWPANIVHDGSDEVVSAFPGAPGQTRAVTGEERAHRTVNAYGEFGAARQGMTPRGDGGSAARFFYSAKADAGDRLGSKHPTVKPVDLMRWLVRLVTPPGGTVLDPFAGSGTTGMACLAEGMDCILVEREAEYLADIRRRIAHVSGDDTPLFGSSS